MSGLFTTSDPTPGPWFVHFDGLAVFGAAPGCQQVVDCEVSSPNLSLEERKANALLIAAAPELLRSCREFVAMYVDVRDQVGPIVAGKLARAAAAIEKAEGR